MAHHPFAAGTLSIDRCPHCRVADPLLAAISTFATSSSKGVDFKWHVYVCSRCGLALLGGTRKEENYIGMIFPEPDKVQDGLPAKAAEFVKQAIESVHAPSGSIMLCASAVDAMLKEKGLKTGTLYKRIEMAAESGTITKEMGAWAHEIRLDANDERHADDDVGLPSPEDAKKCIDFVRALADFMFVLPARVERGRVAAAPKK